MCLNLNQQMCFANYANQYVRVLGMGLVEESGQNIIDWSKYYNIIHFDVGSYRSSPWQ